MVRWGAVDPVAHEVIIDDKLKMPIGMDRYRIGRRIGCQNFNDTNGKQRTVLAVLVLLPVGTARHVIRHRRHLGHRGGRHLRCSHRSYQWCRDKPCDHEDRQQTTDQTKKTHPLTCHVLENRESRKPSLFGN